MRFEVGVAESSHAHTVGYCLAYLPVNLLNVVDYRQCLVVSLQYAVLICLKSTDLRALAPPQLVVTYVVFLGEAPVVRCYLPFVY